MKKSHKVIVGVLSAGSLALAVAAVSAHPGPEAGGMGPHMKGASQHGFGGMTGGPAGAGPAQQLMTPEERTALQKKMRSAATPEERQKIAEATRTEMQKRAADKGITLPNTPAGARGPFNHTH